MTCFINLLLYIKKPTNCNIDIFHSPATGVDAGFNRSLMYSQIYLGNIEHSLMGP